MIIQEIAGLKIALGENLKEFTVMEITIPLQEWE